MDEGVFYSRIIESDFVCNTLNDVDKEQMWKYKNFLHLWDMDKGYEIFFKFINMPTQT